MKPYYAGLEWWHILFVPVYAAAVYAALCVLIKRTLKPDYMAYVLILLGLMIYTGLLLSDITFDWLPFFPDTTKYSDIISGNAAGGSIIHRGFTYCSRPLAWLSFRVPLYYIMLNMGVMFAGYLLIWNAWLSYRGFMVSRRAQRLYLAAALLSPAGMLFAVTPLREALFILALGIFFKGFMKRGGSLLEPIGILLVLLLRRQILLVIFFLYVVKILIWLKRQDIRIGLSILLLSGPIGYGVFTYIGTRLFNIRIHPLSLMKFLNSRARELFLGSPYMYPYVIWYNWGDICKDVPGLVAQFLLAPLPVLVHTNPLHTFAYFIDALFVIGIFLLIGLHLVYIKRWFRYLFWLSAVGLFLVGSAVYEFHLLGAVRHRFFGILLLLPPVVDLLAQGPVGRIIGHLPEAVYHQFTK